MALLSLHQIDLAFSGPPLLTGVGLQIEEGDRLCLLGRNGSGKSTLLKVICGELKPDGGEVQRKPGLKVAWVPQEVPVELAGTVFEVVADGLGEAAGLLAEHHQLGLELAQHADEKALQRMADLQHRLEVSGAWSLHLSVERVLDRLALEAGQDFASLSGGMKRRTLLARALVSSPELLILDEPTNHLDLDSILWLETFIRRFVKTTVFVTHDRAFARGLANRVAELDRGHLFTFGCGYDTFIGRREALLEEELKRQALFDKKLAQEEVWVRQGIKARRTRNEGRVRALEKLREVRRARRATMGSARIQMQEAGRSGAIVAEAQEASFAYDARVIISGLSTRILRGDRIGIIGPNGSGKTTLLRLLLGQLQPQAGSVVQGTRLSVIYFDQLREQLDLEKTVQQNVGDGSDTVSIGGHSRHIIGYLQDFLFTPERARSPVKILSGGERARLLLARLFTQPSNVLVMDEPTNDLDVETLGLLEDRLIDYGGTLLLVSHDRDFLDNVVSSTLVLQPDGSVQEFVGGYADWQRQVKGERQDKISAEARSSVAKKKRGRAAGPRKLSFKERGELEKLPGKIAALEVEQKALHASMGDPGFYKRAATAAAEVKARLAKLEAELEAAYARWQALESVASGESDA